MTRELWHAEEKALEEMLQEMTVAEQLEMMTKLRETYVQGARERGEVVDLTIVRNADASIRQLRQQLRLPGIH
jgi:hypothetical protein